MRKAIFNSLQLFVVLFFALNFMYSQNYDLNNGLDTFWPAPSILKPNYLQEIVDPTFGTTITRITGDVGSSIQNVPGENWRNIARHGYSTRQPWNADESVIYLGKHRNLGSSSGPDLFLDGQTYEVIKEANLPSGNEHRWHHTDPNLFLIIRDTEIITWNYINESSTQLITYSGYNDVDMGGTGNFTDDGKKVAVSARRNSDNKLVTFMLDIENQTKGPDIDISDINSLGHIAISSKGNYIIVIGTYPAGGDRTKVYSVNGNQIGFWTEYGMPSHYDLATDVNGEEVAVGVSKSDPHKGKLIKRRLSDGLVTELTTGGWPPHTSARAINRPGWVFASTSASANYGPYMMEVIAVKLDGSRIERVAHTRNVLDEYLNETHACPSPSGSRVIFASDWDSGNVPIQAYIADFRHLLITDGPNANAGQDKNICDGQSITLSATGGDTYLWNTGETTQSINVTPPSTTTYTVTAFVGGESDTDNVVVNVNAIPTANAGADQTICAGETISLTATGGSSYLWNTGATSPSISVSPNNTATYSVTVTQNGCTDTDDVVVTVNPSPTANAGNDVSILEGESTTLSASGGDTYLWSTGETTQSITVTPNTTTTYSATAFIGSCEDADDVIVTVNSQVAANAGEDVTICENSSTILTASGGTEYLWNTGATTQSINISPNTTTTYSVTVSNGNSSDTDDVVVTVDPNPLANAGSDVTISEGENTTLIASGGNSYLWSTGETTESITVNPNATTTYTVIAILNGCEDSDDVIVTVEAEQVVANAGADVGICEGDSITLTASGGTDYLWSTEETTQSIEVNPNSTTNYTVIVSNESSSDTDDVTVDVYPVPEVSLSNDATILEGNYITLSASGANNYEWSNGALQPNIAVSPDVTTTYVVTGYINNCYDVKDVTVSVVEQVIVDAGEDVFVCLGDGITLSASGSGAEDYLWNTGATTQSITVNPEEDTLYTIMASNSLDSDSDEIMVTVNSCQEEEILPEDEIFSFKAYIDSRISDEILNIKLTGLVGQSALYLFDISGKLIHTDEFDGNDGHEVVRTINKARISDGVYIIKVTNDNNDHSKSIIIQ